MSSIKLIFIDHHLKLLEKIKLFRTVLKSVPLTDAALFYKTFAQFLTSSNVSKNTGYVGSCANIWGLSFARALIRVYDKEDGFEWENHPAVELLKNPFPGFTGWELMYRLATDLIFEGNCYLLKLRPKAGLQNVTGLYLLQADRMDSYPVGVERIDHYLYNTGGATVRLEVNDIIHFRSPDRKSVTKGSPIISRIADVIDVEKMQIEYRKMFYKKGGFLGATFTTSANMGQDAFDRMLDQLQKKYGGNENAFKVALFDNDVKPVPTAYSLKDMQIKEDRELNRDEVCSAFGVNKMLFGQSENIQRGNADTVYYVFYATFMDPLLSYIDQVLTNQFLSVDFPATDGSSVLYAKHDTLAKRDTDQELKYYENGLKYGWLAPDEVREQEGYAALGGEYAVPKLSFQPNITVN